MVVVWCGLLVGCSGSQEVLPRPIPDEQSPLQDGTEAYSESSDDDWPTYGRDVVGVKDASVEWTRQLISETSEFQENRFGGGMAVIWDTIDPRTVEIRSSHEGSAEVNSWSYTVMSDDRYAELVVLVPPATAYLAEAPPLELVALGGPGSRLLRLDLEAHAVQEVLAPAGTSWSPWGAFVEASSSDVFAIARADGLGDCVVRIDGVDAEVLACLEGQQVSFVNVSDDGMSVLTFPWGGSVGDCRQRWQVALDGGAPTSIGPVASCNRFDGVVLEGWEVWSELDPEIPEQYYKAGMLADGPEGQKLSFGLMRTGSLEVCGDYIYWQIEGAGSGWSNYETLRWRPGMEHAERIYVDTKVDVYTGPPRCVDGDTVNITQVSSLDEPPTEEFFTLPANTR